MGGCDYNTWLSAEPDQRDLMKPFPEEPMRMWLEKRVDRCLVAYRKLGPAPQEIMG